MNTAIRSTKAFLIPHIFAFLGAIVVAPLQSQGQFTLTRSIPLPGVEGRIDHLAVDVSGERLFVAAPTGRRPSPSRTEAMTSWHTAWKVVDISEVVAVQTKLLGSMLSKTGPALKPQVSSRKKLLSEAAEKGLQRIVGAPARDKAG